VRGHCVLWLGGLFLERRFSNAVDLNLRILIAGAERRKTSQQSDNTSVHPFSFLARSLYIVRGPVLNGALAASGPAIFRYRRLASIQLSKVHLKRNSVAGASSADDKSDISRHRVRPKCLTV